MRNLTRYRLVIQGEVELEDGDRSIVDLLQGRKGTEEDRLEVAIQLMEEVCLDFAVKLEEE